MAGVYQSENITGQHRYGFDALNQRSHNRMAKYRYGSEEYGRNAEIDEGTE